MRLIYNFMLFILLILIILILALNFLIVNNYDIKRKFS